MSLTGFGRAARHYRIDQDIRQIDLAAQIGVTTSFLSSVETGRKPVPRSWMHRLPDPLRAVAIRQQIAHHEAEIAYLRSLETDLDSKDESKPHGQDHH